MKPYESDLYETEGQIFSETWRGIFPEETVDMLCGIFDEIGWDNLSDAMWQFNGKYGLIGDGKGLLCVTWTPAGRKEDENAESYRVQICWEYTGEVPAFWLWEVDSEGREKFRGGFAQFVDGKPSYESGRISGRNIKEIAGIPAEDKDHVSPGTNE